MNDLCDIELWPFDLEMVHGTLSPPWFYMYMGCVYQEPRSGHGKNFKWPLWPWTLTRFFTQKWCATHRHLMGCVCTTYEVNRSNRDEASGWTRQGVVRSFCRVHPEASSLLDRFTSYVVHTQPMRWGCVEHYIQVKRSKVKVTRVVRSFGRVRSVAPSVLDRFTSYVVHTQPMRWWCVAHHFRVKRSKVKVTGVVWSFGRVRSVAPSLSDRFTSYVVHTQPMRWRCVAHHFWVKKRVKVQGHRGHLKFLPCPLRGSWYTQPMYI